jgi:uncharacterized protein YcbX
MTSSHPLGYVTHLWRYPVKSLAGEPLERAELDADGVAGDRRAALFLQSGGQARSGKTYRGKEHELLHTVTRAGRAIELARERGADLECRDDAGPYFDDAAFSLIFDRWLQEAERHVGYTLDPLRFRPNAFARAAPDFDLAETSLVGRTLAIGSARLRVTAPIGRCVTTTYDIATGASDPAVLRVVAQHRANTMGVYCAIVVPGTLRAGDAILITRDDPPTPSPT